VLGCKSGVPGTRGVRVLGCKSDSGNAVIRKQSKPNRLLADTSSSSSLVGVSKTPSGCHGDRSAERPWPEQPSCVPDITFDSKKLFGRGVEPPFVFRRQKQKVARLRSP
jgi:hypothetical protein